MRTKLSKQLKAIYKSVEEGKSVKLFKKLQELKTKWYYSLLPAEVKNTLEEAVIHSLGYDGCKFMTGYEIAVLKTELETYKHNAKAQKDKSKKYSKLRKSIRETNLLLDELSQEAQKLGLGYSVHYHEHENGL